MPYLNIPKTILFYIISYFSILIIYIPYLDINLKYLIPLIEASYIFYFYVYNKKKPILLFILILSIILDTLNNYQIGTNAIIYFILIKIFDLKRKLFIFSSFAEIWIIFTIFIIELQIIKYITVYYINYNQIDNKILIINLISTIITYPLLHNYYYHLNKLQHKYES